MPDLHRQVSIKQLPGFLVPAFIFVTILLTCRPAIAIDPFPDGQGLSPQLNEESIYKSDNQARKEAAHKVYTNTELPTGKEVPDAFPDLQAKYKAAPSQAMEATGGHVLIKPAMSAAGHIDAFGHYSWTDPGLASIVGSPTIVGQTPDPSFSTHLSAAPGITADLSSAPMLNRAFKGTNGLPATQAGVLSAMITGSMAKVDKLRDPGVWTSAMTSIEHTKTTQSANNEGRCAEKNCDTAFDAMQELLINITNDGVAASAPSDVTYKSYPQAVWMVQQMYKKCFIPMAILLLLPGAILTQAKGMISFGFFGSSDEDSITPFQGIIRGAIAIFLIPATQIIVSYAIDIGNSLSITVKTQVDSRQLKEWAHEQTFYTAPHNAENYLKKAVNPAEPQFTGGKLDGASKEHAVFEQQSQTSSMLQYGFNKLNNLLGQGLVVLTAFQVVLMCYLFLLGPIAAAFYAWPAGEGRTIFKRTFGSWLDGVMVLALWKFWWCVVLLCMDLRLKAGNVNPADQFETYIYTSFMVLLMFVPFSPFDFRPGDLVSTLLDKAGHKGAGAASGGGSSGNSRAASPSQARCGGQSTATGSPGASNSGELSRSEDQSPENASASSLVSSTRNASAESSNWRNQPSLAASFVQSKGDISGFAGGQTSHPVDAGSTPPPHSSSLSGNSQAEQSAWHYSTPPPLTNGGQIVPPPSSRHAA